MSIGPFKKISLATLIIALLFYIPFGFSKIMHLTGAQDYWGVFWLVSYFLYIVGGIYFAHLFKKNEEVILAGIAFVILGGHWLILGSSVSAKYFLSHSFYGLFVLAMSIFVCRLKQKQ